MLKLNKNATILTNKTTIPTTTIIIKTTSGRGLDYKDRYFMFVTKYLFRSNDILLVVVVVVVVLLLFLLLLL